VDRDPRGAEAMTALLVTGSRSLEKRLGMRERSADVIRMAVWSLRITHVIAGDAYGPDTWATQCAQARRLTWERWALDGFVRYQTGDIVMWWKEGDPMLSGKSWPLVRNDRMVRSVGTQFPGAWCLALVDPRSRTHGTDHTARLAENAGLRVIRCVYGA